MLAIHHIENKFLFWKVFMYKNLHIEAFNTVNKMGLFLFSMLLRLLKLGKLAEYFSPFYPKVCHYPIITFSRHQNTYFLMRNLNFWSKIFKLNFWRSQCLRLLRPCRRWRGWKKKSMSFHQYSWNFEVETTWISLIGWHHKTSST